ncbi:Tyrosine-protein kinase RYK [Aphelenchoides besseyi]|nr:Tyrosine-protein kinase RYK [Aphelenchoides besseyi]
MFSLFIMLPTYVESKINLFISRREMNRTLGVLAEMNYVENGVINAYSTKFPYRVAPNVSHVIFTWNTVVKDRPISYKLQAVAEDYNVLPIVDIPTQGVLPIKTETFAVEYRCAGSREGQFMVTLHFNISYPSIENGTVFTLKQEKICASKDGRRNLAGASEHDYAQLESSGLSNSNIEYVLYVAIISLLFLAALGLIAFCIYGRTKRKGGGSRLYGGAGLTNRNIRSTPTSFPTKDTSVFDSPSQPFLQPTTSTPVSKLSTPRLTVFDDTAGTSKEPKIIFERKQNVDINHVLVELYADRNLFQVLPFIELEGTFGEVRWAVWRQTGIGLSGDIDDEEDDVNEEIPVICKTLKHTTDRSHFERFIREALVFHNVPQHLNLAQVSAAATFGHFNNPQSIKDFPLIAYRHTGFGFLKRFLLTCRGIAAVGASSDVATSSSGRGGPGNSAANQTLRTHDLVSMSIQTLKAIIHLHRFGLIHKDVATRNCLIAEVPAFGLSDRLHVQLTDAALSRDVFPEDYHTPPDAQDDITSRPLKWMAPEAIRSNVYNSASDVWSFGVFMWELFTCGQQPYQEISFDEMPSSLAAGTRLGQPFNCPDELYAIIYSCWHQEVMERPTTAQLQKALDDFSQQLRKYI